MALRKRSTTDSKAVSASAEPAPKKRSKNIPATRSREARFNAMLQRKCLRAASIGAFTALAESVPGLGRLFGFVFSELLDFKLLSTLQRELVEETLSLYEVSLPEPLHSALVRQIQTIGVGASAAGDLLGRRLLTRLAGGLGGVIARRVAPVAAIVSSAASNAAVTYAIGKRAQAAGLMRDAPLGNLPDALRTFSGIDERRILSWTTTSVKRALSAFRDTLARANPLRRKAKAKPELEPASTPVVKLKRAPAKPRRSIKKDIADKE
jgi:uncharacterized protein (DUF697 family)